MRSRKVKVKYSKFTNRLYTFKNGNTYLTKVEGLKNIATKKDWVALQEYLPCPYT